MKFLTKVVWQGRQHVLLRAALASSSLLGMILTSTAGGHWF
jgi:hypothetical protein